MSLLALPARQERELSKRRAMPPRLRFGLLAVALYAGLRAFGVLVLWWFAAEQHRGVLALLGRYDTVHYARIAVNGYDHSIGVQAGGLNSNLAFFPLFPTLISVFDPMLPGGAATAAIVLSWLAGLAAAAGLYALGAYLRGPRAGVLLAGLWAVVPHAVVQSMGYTETLFTALAAWSLLAVLRRQWLTAAGLCVLAGLTRPTGAALIAAVGLAALVAVCRRQDGWRPWLAGALAPAGLLGYVAWVGFRLGHADGYFRVQRDGWGMSYDTGRYTLETFHRLLTEKNLPVAYYVTTSVLLVALALAVLLFDVRVPWPLTVYALVIVAMVFFGDGFFHAKSRLLMPAFPLLLPVAFLLARARGLAVIVALASLSAMSAGYGVYLCLVWGYSP